MVRTHSVRSIKQAPVPPAIAARGRGRGKGQGGARATARAPSKAAIVEPQVALVEYQEPEHVERSSE